MKTSLDWDEIEKDIARILQIVKTYPDNLQVQCFQYLLSLLSMPKANPKASEQKITEEPKDDPPAAGSHNGGPTKIHGNVLALLRKNKLEEADIHKLFMLDHDPILPVYRVTKKSNARAQIQKTFMILLENAIKSGQFRASYQEVRDTCKEEGLYDGNFTLNLRKESENLSGAVNKDTIDESGDIVLAPAGYKKMAEIINDLKAENV